jgi:eukaryotic-like serine/threonine-protein kinase
VAARVDAPFARGWVTLAAGFAAFLEGRFRQARDRCEQAEAVFRDCVGVWWEVGSARLFSLWSLFYLGELGELARRQPVFLKEAEERGDRYTATSLRLSVLGTVWLAADDPERARTEAEEAIQQWSRHGYHSPHYWHLVADVSASLYAGDARRAWARVEEDWGKMRRALFLRIQQARIEAFGLRARAALALATATPPGGERDRLLAEAERSARRIAREHMRWGSPLAKLVRAGAAAQSGDGDAARAALADAAGGFDAADMALHAAVARRCEGRLRGGAAGAADVARADAWLASAGVKNPERMVSLLAPGFAYPVS